MIYQGYEILLRDYANVMPGKGDVGSDRRKIHTHHTQHGYVGNAVNAHHRHLSTINP